MATAASAPTAWPAKARHRPRCTATRMQTRWRPAMRNELLCIRRALASMLIGAALCGSALAADIQIINASPPGVGLNDPTPAAPVGGIDGTTVGAQSLKVFERVAEIWGKKLRSDVPISVLTFYERLDCDATSAVLGAA